MINQQHMEQNFDPNLQPNLEQTSKKFPTWVIVVASVVITALVVGITTYFFVKNKQVANNQITPIPIQSNPGQGSQNIQSVSVIKDLHDTFALQNYKINISEPNDMWWIDTSGVAVNVRTPNILDFNITDKAQDDYSVENMSSNPDIAKVISAVDNYASLHGFALQNAQSSSVNPKIEGFVYTHAYYNSNSQTRCRLEITNPYGGEGETPPYTFTATITCADNQEYTDAYNKQAPFLKVLVNNKDLMSDINVVDNDYKIEHCVEDPSIIVIKLDDLTSPGTNYVVMREAGNSWVYLGVNGVNRFCAQYN